MFPNKNWLASLKFSKLPVWSQVLLGLIFVGAIFYFGTRTALYVSAWDEENSSFYENVEEALRIFSVHPSAPTVFVFWEMECDDCLENIRQLNGLPTSIRVYGIHLSGAASGTLPARRQWLKLAPKSASLIFDRSQLLQTSFHVRSLPQVFVYLPREKRIFSLYGQLKPARKRMLDIISSR